LTHSLFCKRKAHSTISIGVIAMTSVEDIQLVHVRPRPRILCVDDNAAFLYLNCLVLQQHGYEVLTCTDPITAIDILQKKSVDLAVLDYDMPRMNGGELAAIARREGLVVKIILFTGRDKVQVPERDLAFVDLFVRKSDGVEALLSAVESLLAVPDRVAAA
jgi:CheY-like chemotaxis protein